MTAWTAPRTWIVGETMLAAVMNQHVRDNELNLNERVTVLETVALDRALVYRTTALGVNNNAFTAVTFDAEVFDSNGLHSTVTNISRLTCQTAGVYLIWGNVEYAANAVGYRWAAIRKGGATYLAEAKTPGSDAADVAVMPISCIRDLAVNDYVELMVKQTSGGSLNVQSSSAYSPYFGMVKLTPP